jgi:hypothetical protein
MPQSQFRKAGLNVCPFADLPRLRDPVKSETSSGDFAGVVVHYNQVRPDSRLGLGIPELSEKPKRKPEVKDMRFPRLRSRSVTVACPTIFNIERSHNG